MYLFRTNIAIGNKYDNMVYFIACEDNHEALHEANILYKGQIDEDMDNTVVGVELIDDIDQLDLDEYNMIPHNCNIITCKQLVEGDRRKIKEEKMDRDQYKFDFWHE